jgi:hypothetical protein
MARSRTREGHGRRTSVARRAGTLQHRSRNEALLILVRAWVERTPASIGGALDGRDRTFNPAAQVVASVIARVLLGESVAKLLLY